ncbi:hypothetical protein [Desulfosediminicola ganghwensis]|nr:hypothetical protein [Desulfosediminicola ganghwensis]
MKIQRPADKTDDTKDEHDPDIEPGAGDRMGTEYGHKDDLWRQEGQNLN